MKKLLIILLFLFSCKKDKIEVYSYAGNGITIEGKSYNKFIYRFIRFNNDSTLEFSEYKENNVPNIKLDIKPIQVKYLKKCYKCIINDIIIYDTLFRKRFNNFKNNETKN